MLRLCKRKKEKRNVNNRKNFELENFVSEKPTWGFAHCNDKCTERSQNRHRRQYQHTFEICRVEHAVLDEVLYDFKKIQMRTRVIKGNWYHLVTPKGPDARIIQSGLKG